MVAFLAEDLPAAPASGTSMRIGFTDYQQLDAVNMSALSHMATSPLHYRNYLDNGRRDSDAFRLGRAVHMAVLEPARFEEEAVFWSATRRGKDWEAFARVHAKRTILTHDQYDNCIAMRDAVRGHAVARRYLEERGSAEVTFVWRHPGTGLLCKIRIDWLLSHAQIDLKSSIHAKPFQFGRQAANLGYHMRCAFYSDGLFYATGERLPVKIIAVEKSEPHDVVVYDVPEDVIDAGRLGYEPLLTRVAECIESGEWPGVAATEELDLRLPSWAFGDDTPDTIQIDGQEVAF